VAGLGTIDVNVKFDGVYCEKIPPLKAGEVVAVYAPQSMRAEDATSLIDMTAKWLGISSEQVAVYCNGTRLAILENNNG
jgi:hypothetical protein